MSNLKKLISSIYPQSFSGWARGYKALSAGVRRLGTHGMAIKMVRWNPNAVLGGAAPIVDTG
jgi:hypothetical protein